MRPPEPGLGHRTISCRYCSATLIARSSRYGYWFKCTACDASVGCHKGTDVPLGTMAKPALRQKRMDAHAALDPFWKLGVWKRSKVYRKLAQALGIKKQECHIGNFEAEQCEQVIAITDEWKRKHPEAAP